MKNVWAVSITYLGINLMPIYAPYILQLLVPRPDIPQEEMKWDPLNASFY